MEQEEKILMEQFGRQNPFRVPEGYFDSLTERVMTQLPERDMTQQPARKPKSRIVALRHWFYAAACIDVMAVMGITYYFHQTEPIQQVATNEISAPAPDNSYVDEAADYAMLDNVEIYAYLADAEI